MKVNKSQSFVNLMAKHKGIIYKVVNSYCQNKFDRQDLAQEILTTMWLAFDKYDSDFKFSTWMYRIALNVAISYYRKDSKRQDKQHLDEACIIQIAEPPKDDRNEKIGMLHQFISQLDKLNKGIILLYLEGETYDCIAQSLGITKTNVATRISRIKDRLKKQFRTEEF